MKLHIATPMYGGNCTAGYASSMLNLSKLLPYDHNFITNESLVTRARNMLVHNFLSGDCTHLLFIDADVAFDPYGVVKMTQSGKEVIGGLYAKKVINWDRVGKHRDINISPESLAYDYYVRGNVKLGSDTPVEVDRIGTGLLLISRSVFDKLKADTPVSRLGSTVVGQVSSDALVHHFFDTGVDDVTGEFLSEDYAFCQRWKAKNGKVYAAPWIRTIHIGTHHFG